MITYPNRTEYCLNRTLIMSKRISLHYLLFTFAFCSCPNLLGLNIKGIHYTISVQATIEVSTKNVTAKIFIKIWDSLHHFCMYLLFIWLNFYWFAAEQILCDFQCFPLWKNTHLWVFSDKNADLNFLFIFGVSELFLHLVESRSPTEVFAVCSAGGIRLVMSYALWPDK